MPRTHRETSPSRPPGIASRTALTPLSSRSFSLLLSVLLAVPLTTAACTGGSVTGSGATTTAASTGGPSAAPTTAPSPTTAAATASTSTGAPTLLPSPVLAVKIDNTSPARPRIGIGSADIVYIEPVEGGLTRLLAVFSSRMPAQVGPVRSARESDGALLGNYGRVAFAYSGGSAYTLARVAKGPQIDVSYDTSAVGYRREPRRAAPYNVIGDPAALLARAAGAQPAGDLGWRLGPAPAGGAPASRLEAAYPAARVAFTWDPTRGRYLVATDGSPEVDGGTDAGTGGQQVGAATVLVLTVPVSLSANVDVNGARTPLVGVVGSGPVRVLREGQAYSGTWTRPSAAAPTTLTTAAGAGLTLAGGPVWVLLVAAGTAVTIG